MTLSKTPPSPDSNHKIILQKQEFSEGGGQRIQIISIQGHEILLMDSPGGPSKIQITSSDGELQIRLDEAGKELYIGAFGGNKLVLESDSNVSVKSRKKVVVEADGDITVHTKSDLKVEVVGNVILHANSIKYDTDQAISLNCGGSSPVVPYTGKVSDHKGTVPPDSPKNVGANKNIP